MDDYNERRQIQCWCDVNAQSVKSKTKYLFFVVDKVLPQSSDIDITTANDVLFFGRFYKLCLKIKKLRLRPLTQTELFTLCCIIHEIVFEIQSATTPRNSIFAIILKMAMDAIGFPEAKRDSQTFGNFCKVHFLELDSHVQYNIIQPVKILEEKLLHEVCNFIHKTQDFQVIADLMKICPKFRLQLLTDNNDQSLLHFASLVNEDVLEIISLCLKEIPFKNLEEFVNLQRLDDGNTALHLASQNGKVNIVQCLLEHGANTWLKNNIGLTALNVAANDSIVNLIKKANLFDSADVIDHFLTTFLQNKIVSELKKELLTEDIALLDDAIDCANVAKVEEILQRDKSCVNGTNKMGVTPLMKAIGLENVEIVQILLQNGADASEMFGGMNALHYAVKKGDMRVVDVLLDYIDVNACCQGTGHSALHVAAESGNVAIVKLLLARGANIESKNVLKQTPISVSINMDVSYLFNAILDLHRIVQEDDPSEENSVIDIFMKFKRSDDFDVLLKATNDDGKTATQLMKEKKGPGYLWFKKAFLCTPEPPAGS